MRGKYFLLEGEEGCGKDTQLQLLQESFQNKGYDIIVTREPGGTAESDQIRKVLLGSKNRFSKKTLEYHQRVRQGYLDVAKKFSNFSVVIDYREGDIEGMHKEIMGHINKKLKIK